MKRVYIAGPMSGYEAYNVDAFDAAVYRWSAVGFNPRTPFEANSVVWRRHHGRDFDPTRDVCDWGDPILKEMLLEDVALMGTCEIIALLPGWQKSRGVSHELPLAKALGLEVWDAVTVKPMPPETILQEAQRLVHGDRGADYGHPADDYTRTGRIWGALLGIPDIDPRICTLMMAGMKLSRETHKHKRDSLVDLAGYAECAALVAQRQEGK